MQKILRKRILRELKSNCFRYLALGFLIVLGMYLVVSLVGAADTVIQGVNAQSEKHNLENGQFGVFIPLTQGQEEELKDKGITLEKMFYLDYLLKDDSTVRVFKNRKAINQIALDTGRLAKKTGEAAIEKRYAQEQKLSLGDTINIDDRPFQIVGIGSVPDYDSMLKNMTDSSVDSRYFGLLFVTDKQYQELKEAGNYRKTEEYTYAYRRSASVTDEEVKSYLMEFDFDVKDVKDPYFQEFYQETAGKKEDIKEGIQSLSDGAGELEDGLTALTENNESLKMGSNEIFEAYLKEANKGLSEYGYKEQLTEENYESVLSGYIDSSDNGIFRLQVRFIWQDLDHLKEYKEGIASYTNGVSKSAGGAGRLSEGMRKLEENTDELLEEYAAFDLDNLTQFIMAKDNPRIEASSDDQVINKLTGLAAGVIVMILFTYVISVFVIHGIERESSVIGSLYALGVKKRELIIHYLTLPVSVTLVAGLFGTALGFSKLGVNVQMKDCYTYFSIPNLEALHPAYLILYGSIMPPVVAALVNYFVISQKLSQPALKLIRNEQKSKGIYNLDLGNLGFIGKFRIRQMLRELRTGFTVIFGMFISLLVMMMAIDCYVLCENISVENKADTRYEYMYTYKYPQKEVPEGGEACYMETLSKEAYGYQLDVTMVGIDSDNPYFKAGPEKGKNKIVIASATAQKFSLKKGDKLILKDRIDDMDYAFTVEDIVPYSVGLYVFMDIDSMRELFGQQEAYFNAVLSSGQLNIDPGRLYAVTTKEDVSKSSEVFISKMLPMVIMLMSISILIFFVVMYLMMKVMVDRAAFGISLVKIFGYRTGEIRKLYLNGNFYIVMAGALISIPLSKGIMDRIYPYLISNVACGMNLSFSWQLYLGIFAGIMMLYFVINQMLVGRLKKMVPAEVLKSRE